MMISPGPKRFSAGRRLAQAPLHTLGRRIRAQREIDVVPLPGALPFSSIRPELCGYRAPALVSISMVGTLASVAASVIGIRAA
jgi:hypothetical protein